MLAHCLLHRCRHSRRQSPLRARTCSLHACAIPARVHRARMPCTFLHLPCPYLRASSVCAQVPCFLCLHRFESSASCIRSARWVYTGALTHLSHNHWDPPPPQSWACGVDIYISAWHGRLRLTSCSPLPSTCTAKILNLSSQSHNTLACNYFPPHTHTLYTAYQRTWKNCSLNIPLRVLRTPVREYA